MWVVYDNKNLNSMKHDGIVQGVGVMVPIGAKLTKFEEEWPAAEKAGWAVKANTLEELAKKTGMDPEKLKASVEQYNNAAEVRHDALFAKDPQYIFPVKEGRFLRNQERCLLSRNTRRHQKLTIVSKSSQTRIKLFLTSTQQVPTSAVCTVTLMTS